MWVSHGCFGQFECDGLQLRCGDHEWPPWTNCSCAEVMNFDRTLGADGSRSTLRPGRLPPSMAVRRLRPPDDWNPTFKQRHSLEHRFVPRDENETFSSIFTMWNLLDRMMLTHEPNHNFAAGYVRELQLRRMYRLVNSPTTVQTYCEIGLNGGHSAVAMLLMSPLLKVIAFDLLMWRYSQPVVELLRQLFQERFELHPGDSADTVRAFARNSTERCNLIFIDGSHKRRDVLRDLQQMTSLSAPGAAVIADDIGAAPGCDVRDAQDAGLVAVEEIYGPFDSPSPHNPCRRGVCTNWGFVVLRYKPAAQKTRRWKEAYRRERAGGFRGLRMLHLRCWQELRYGAPEGALAEAALGGKMKRRDGIVA